MTGERLVGEPVRSDRPGNGTQALDVAEILGLCDSIVGHPGRRRHLFGWLKAPGAGPEQWLVVDSYYPASRLVIVCRAEPGPDDHVYRELIPPHGLRLLELAPSELGADRSAAEASLRKLIADIAPARPRIGEAPLPPERAVARAMASLAIPPIPAPPERRRVGRSQAEAAERAARFVARRPAPARTTPRPALKPWPAPRPGAATAPRPAPRPQKPRQSPPGAPIHGLDLVLGVALLVIVFAEVYGLVVRAGLDQGRLLLAFGIALDTCARTLGTVAAGRSGSQGWAWACALGGSPVVAGFAIFQGDGPVRTEPAPLAGLIALLASLLIAVALAAASLGI